jgi:hypothetical protein
MEYDLVGELDQLMIGSGPLEGFYSLIKISKEYFHRHPFTTCHPLRGEGNPGSRAAFSSGSIL